MSARSSNYSEPSFDNHMSRIQRLRSKMEDLRSTRKICATELAMWGRMVYTPDSIRGIIKGIIKKNVIVDPEEWDKCTRKKEELLKDIDGIDEQLKRLQEEMDPLLLGLLCRKGTVRFEDEVKD